LKLLSSTLPTSVTRPTRNAPPAAPCAAAAAVGVAAAGVGAAAVVAVGAAVVGAGAAVGGALVEAAAGAAGAVVGAAGAAVGDAAGADEHAATRLIPARAIPPRRKLRRLIGDRGDETTDDSTCFFSHTLLSDGPNPSAPRRAKVRPVANGHEYRGVRIDRQGG
jgi:hypothetical protein